MNAGADDYMGKAFELSEVEARLRALVRRSHKTDDHVELGHLALNRKRMQFFIADEPLFLPRREFEVMWELITPPGNVVSKKMLADKISDVGGFIRENALEAIFYRLRKKIALSGASIRTLRGIGYLLELAR